MGSWCVLPPAFHEFFEDAIALHLRNQPKRMRGSRIKRLRGLDRPQYRLRVGEVRVSCDVTEATVQVLAIIPKAEAAAWLAGEATPTAPGRPGQGEG
jgi:mRNA interferase RelE/StbE